MAFLNPFRTGYVFDSQRRGDSGMPNSLEMLEPRLLLSADIGGAGGVGGHAEIQSGYVQRLGLSWEAQARYVTADAEGSHTTTPGVDAFGVNTDGVVKLLVDTAMGTFLGSGALLWTGQHILTAAHVVTDELGQIIADSIQVIFSLPGGETTVTASDVTLHPQWDGLYFENGNDLAIIELPTVITHAPGYHIWEGGGETKRDTVKVGYGQAGQGDIGTTIGAGTQRAGLNRYDGDATVFRKMGAKNGREQLAYDFDSGNRSDDAFGFFYGQRDLGYGDDEVGSAPGDSGGPTFAYDPNDGRYEIVGVTSYGFRVTKSNGSSSDVDGQLNSSFGEFNVDTRVSSFANFIEQQIGNVPALNHRPVANAGLDQQVTNGDRVQLDGSRSSDLNARDVLSYQWEIVNWPGGKPAISNATAEKATFVADEAGTYDIQLTVTDPAGLTHTDVVRITAAAPAPGIHVADIDASAFKGKRKQWGAQVSVLVVDQNGDPVSNARVAGSFGDGRAGTVWGVTRGNGRASLTTPNWAKGSSITFTVDDVTGPLAYNESSNVDVERDSNGSFIRIYRQGRKSPRVAAVEPASRSAAAEAQPAWNRFVAPTQLDWRPSIDSLAMAAARTGPLSLHDLLRDGGAAVDLIASATSGRRVDR